MCCLSVCTCLGCGVCVWGVQCVSGVFMCVCMSGVCSVCVVCDVCVSGVWSVCVMFVCVFVSRGWNVWVVLV